jgi:hypothetical protein
MQMLSSKEYIMAEVACKHDKSFEKKTWDERIAHFHTIDLADPKLFKKASDPIGLRAAAIAYDDATNQQPSGYMISLDACSSGLQILSLLVSCPKSFDLCGGTQDQCVDSYTAIYSGMNLHGVLTRKQVKQAIMTSFYGSTAMPESTFGEHIDLFYDTISAMAPGAWDLNLGLQELWDEIPGSTYQWKLPDNFHACIETKDRELIPFKFLEADYSVPVKIDARPDFHKGLGPNLIHSVDGFVVREMFRRCMFNAHHVSNVMMWLTEDDNTSTGKSAPLVKELWNNYLETGFLSTRILDYLHKDTLGLVDANVIADLILTLPSKPFQLVSVHDCFRCHPNYGNDLRRQYNTILAAINDSNILEFIAKQVAHQGIKAKKVGKIDRDLILNANYTLA